ncbi:proliferation marker protein Ki-67 isoform X2 [Sebastes umbrosus]|uniref:proliferation marker protein Ki-67 isoform X2 n=1 Tax=Sebastes umbrosus TaxID=72105 RepID=UPI00189F7338|nr:proliferation marker protein Ki-67 isoform X2 [Sebastes umbrosus]
MPLHGKLVVIKRSGGEGTELPLTATCLFGRSSECDIRIQLPQVSKEHCRIALNENKEVILTNLSSSCPTRVNGETLLQSECLKHGDVITVFDRSFRFEAPPPPTPKKRPAKTETVKVLQDQQVGDTVATETGEKKIPEVSTDPHLKDGTNNDNIQRSLEKTVEVEAKGDDSLLQSKTASPFSDLYQMIKQSLDVKTPRKSSASVLQTPTSRFCTPKPYSVRKNDGKPVISTEDKSTPKKDEAIVPPVADETKGEAENVSNGTPKSVKKQRRSFQVPSTEMAKSEAENAAKPEDENAAKSEATSPQKRSRTPPKRFTAGEVIEQISATPPVRRRSKEAKPAVTEEQEEQAATSPKTDGLRKASPRNSGKVEKVKETSKKRKSEELGADLPAPKIKRKRVSFGGFLCPELFDKRLPPDSPLCKGASPRRSLVVSKPNQSLLRRASVIGLLQEKKMRTPSPKKSPSSKNASPKTPTPGKTTPKSRSPSPKAATPAKKSPKPRTPSPKAATTAKTSPKPRTPSPKAATTAKKTPKSKSPSPARGRSPTVQTPKVQGRFSVSHITTPSPIAEVDVSDQLPSVTESPKITQRRKSTSRETPSTAKVIRRRSGISRASMKVKNSWADIVRFGQTKAQVAAPAKKTVTKKTTKKTVSKPQTPAMKLKGLVSTGHADSPVTIVVGRAHKLTVVHPTGAAPKLVTNVALFKKNMKMDEDLTGISEMLKTPVNPRKGRSVINENNAAKTPAGTSVVEPSVLNTPEEPGEMMVSPLSVSSAVKDRSYNSEAVQRLLDDDQESSFVSDTPALDDSSEQQCPDLKTTSVTTPKQKPELPECLTGGKKIMKTPRQKAEAVEDLRAKILKTPKQKPEQQECLTGVKRIMKTPRQKAEPVEDLRGKILKTPKQKPEQQECLTGVKRMMETPRRGAEPVEDIKVELLTTPKQTPEQQECLTEVETICETPQQQSAPVEGIEGLQELMEEPVTEPTGQLETHEIADQTPLDCDEDVAKELDFAPKEQQDDVPSDVVDDVPQVDMEKDANEVVVDDHLKEETSGHDDDESLDVVETAAVEDNLSVEQTKLDTVDEGVSEEQPKVDTVEDVSEEQPKVDTVNEDVSEEQPKVDTVDEDVSEEQPKVETANEDVSEEQPKEDTADEKLSEKQPEVDTVDVGVSKEQPKVDNVDEDVSEEQPKVDTVDEDVSEEQPKVDTIDEDVSEEQPKVDTVDEDVSEEQPKVDTVDEDVSEEQPKVDTVDEDVSEEQPKEETTTGNVTEMDTTATNPVHEKKLGRGRRAKPVESKAADDKQEAAEHSEELVIPAPVRGRRGKKTEAAAPPAVRKPTRGKNAKSQESTSDDQPEIEPEKTVETLVTEVPSEAVSDQTSPVKENAPPAEEAVVKPVRGRKTKQTPVEPEPEKNEVASDAQPEQSIPALGKPKRGRKTKPDTVEQNEVAEDAVVAVETKQQSQPPVRAKRGRNAKQEEESVETTKSQEPATKLRRTRKAEQNQASGDQAEIVQEVKTEMVPEPERMETTPQAPVTESLPEVETATCEVSEMVAAVVQKKPGRGKRAKPVESKSADDKQEAAEHSEELVIPAPVRGRRGKKTEAAAPPAVRKTTRGRNAKSQESPSDDQPEMEPEKVVEALVTEVPFEAVSDQTSPVKENDSAPPAEEAVVKPVRGRKTKQTPVELPQPEPENNEAVNDEPPTEDAQLQKSIPALGKPKRGRKAKPDTVEQNEVAEDAVVAVETKQQSQPPVRARRGRNAKQEEEKSTSVETIKSQEPATKLRRTRKAEPNQVEPREEEVKAVETVVPEEAEAPVVAEPVKMTEQATKPKRGGRKAKQDPESETPVEEVPAVSATDKLKRGRRGKQATEEDAVTAVVPEEKPEELETEEKNEPDTPVIKQSRARGAKTAVKSKVSEAVPAKRVRRGAAGEETNAESTVLVSEPVSTPVKPAKKGRQAAAKPTADSSSAVVEDTKTSKKAVNWKADLEDVEILKATPVKAVRGRKAKLGGQVDTESKEADKTEETDLSDNVVEAQPVKRARRGAKVADKAEVESVEADAQPKTRRGRTAKK